MKETKTIGIMSMQRIKNYGSFLQAYALKQIVESIGYKVLFIDYVYEKSLISKKNNYILGLLKRIKKMNLFCHYKIKKYYLNFDLMYSYNLKNVLNIGEKMVNKSSIIDELIIGSDEVFNCMQSFPVGYSRQLFGFNYENIPVISYAASFGYTGYNDLKKYNIISEMSKMLLKFKAISVRDDNSYNVINKLINKKCFINLDPVLIANFSEFININQKSDYRNYILIYVYGSRLTNKEARYIYKYAKRNNKKIVSIGSYQQIADYNLIVNPLDIFQYFKNADYVLTDTFHGTIFSIKTHANFCTIIRESNKNKLFDLLKRLKLTSRIINNIEELDNKYFNNFDYYVTDQIIEFERKRAIDYLKNNLNT